MEPTEDIHDADSWKTAGNSAYKAGEYQSAIAAYSKAILADSSNAALFTNRAAASLMLLQYKEALDDCNSALVRDSTNSKAYFRKATALKGLGLIEEAIAALTEGLRYDPKSGTALKDKEVLEQAVIKVAELKLLMAGKQYTTCMPQIDRLQSLIGSNFRALNFLKAECLMNLKRPEEAYNLTNVMMKSAANGDVELLHLRAQIFYYMGDLDNALKHLQQAVRSDPDNTHVRTYYRKIRNITDLKKSGDEYFRSGANEEAISSWSQAIECSTDNSLYISKLLLNRATALSRLRKYAESVADCSAAIQKNKEYVKAYLRRAESYIAIGEPGNIQLAISDYEQLLEIETEESNLNSIKDKLKKAKIALKRSKRKDLYSLLGVSHGATEAEIKTAYRKSALRLHPDKQAGKSEEEKKVAETKFKAVNEAYEVLSNPEKKGRYDQGIEVEDLDNPNAGPGGGGGGFGPRGPGGIDPHVFFQHFMQQQGGGRAFGGRF